jgi:hypothetical protein
MTDFGGTYSTGTASVTNGSTTVTFDGTLMTTQATQGDHLLIDGLLVMVDSVTDDEEIELRQEWQGDTLVDVDYILNKVAASRYDPANTQAKAREFLAYFEGIGTFYFVEGDEPDPGLGQNGQFALKVNEGPWQIWYKVLGVWELQGSPVGVSAKGPYNSGTSYILGDWVSWQGSLWSSLQAPNLNHQPDLSPTYWRRELTGGDRYDVWSFDTDRPSDAEQVAYGFPGGVTFDAGLSTSYAKAKVASTGTAVYSIRKNGVQFATVTFSAGNPVGAIACASSTTFDQDDEYEMIAPSPRDATLAGVAINIVGYR